MSATDTVAGLQAMAFEAGMITATQEPTVCAFLVAASGYINRSAGLRGDVVAAMCTSLASSIDEVFARFDPKIVTPLTHAECLEAIAAALAMRADDYRQAAQREATSAAGDRP